MPAAASKLRRFIVYTLIAVPLAAAGYGAWVWWRITREFDQRAWNMPAQVFAAPLELYAGRQLSANELVDGAAAARLRAGVGRARPRALFRRTGNVVDVRRRAFVYDGATVPEQALHVEIRGTRISEARGRRAHVHWAVAQLEPLLIGNIFPPHGEDRLDRRTGRGAAAADRDAQGRRGSAFRDAPRHRRARDDARRRSRTLRAGEISQGGSTLTMQLVRSYFLSNRQTYTRKIREALMSLVLELVHDKDEIMLAYVNEIYLGQDGARAVHGFGLASRFYFGKPLDGLDVHEIALLVAIVRGPSYYDPRRNPERALARRALVLEQMRDAGLIDARALTRAARIARSASSRPKTPARGVLPRVHGSRAPAAARGVRRQGSRGGRSRDLHDARSAIQAAAEEALVEELERLQGKRPSSRAPWWSRARIAPRCARSSAASASASTASIARSTRGGRSDR